MAMTSMRVIALLLPLAAIAGAAFAQVPGEARDACAPRDHYEPSALREFAQRSADAGDLATARVLLARAARLAPNAPLLSPIPAKPPATGEREPPRVPAPPPPLWPGR